VRVLPLFDEHRSRDDAGDQGIDAQEKESPVIETTHAASTFRFDRSFGLTVPLPAGKGRWLVRWKELKMPIE
jgi:hypothetical protein